MAGIRYYNNIEIDEPDWNSLADFLGGPTTNPQITSGKLADLLAMTDGGLLYVLAGALAQDPANLFWDNTNKRLGIGTTTPATLIHALNNQSSGTGIAVENDSVGTGAYSEVRAHNGAAAGNAFRLMCMGTGWTTSDPFVQDSGVLDAESALSGGMSIIARAGVGVIRFYTGGNNERMRIDSAGKVGLGTTTPGAQLNVTSAIEIKQTATLTAGSAGSLIVPINAGAFTDAIGGNLSGAHGLDTTNSKAWWRVGTTWKGVALAGFSIPNEKWIPKYKGKRVVGYRRNPDKTARDETKCPLCQRQMKPGDALGMYADKWYNDRDSKEGLHALACHLSCAMKITGDR